MLKNRLLLVFKEIRKLKLCEHNRKEFQINVSTGHIQKFQQHQLASNKNFPPLLQNRNQKKTCHKTSAKKCINNATESSFDLSFQHDMPWSSPISFITNGRIYVIQNAANFKDKPYKSLLKSHSEMASSVRYGHKDQRQRNQSNNPQKRGSSSHRGRKRTLLENNRV